MADEHVRSLEGSEKEVDQVGEETDVLDPELQALEAEETGDDGADGTTPRPEGRLRDVLFKELRKRDDAIQGLQTQLSSGFGELKGMLAASQSADQPGGQGTQPESKPDLTDEQIQQYIEAGRGPEVFKYIAQREAAKIAAEEAQRARQSMRDEQTALATTNELYREFPELKSGVHPLTLKTNEIYTDLCAPYGGHDAVKGTSLQVQLAGRAAERAVRMHPDLRDEAQRQGRASRNATDTARSTGGGLAVGRGKPRSETDDLPVLTGDDLVIAESWGIPVKDEKVAKRIRQLKAEEAAKRYERRTDSE